MVGALKMSELVPDQAETLVRRAELFHEYGKVVLVAMGLPITIRGGAFDDSQLASKFDQSLCLGTRRCELGQRSPAAFGCFAFRMGVDSCLLERVHVSLSRAQRQAGFLEIVVKLS